LVKKVEESIVNRVAVSALVSIDMEEFFTPGERAVFDIKDLLYQGLVLKEKEFRDFIKSNNWSAYRDKLVSVVCSADAIVPTWAYMLLSVALQPFARKVFFGSVSEMESHLYQEALASVPWEKYRDAKVVIKGCSKVQVPASAYVEVTNRLRPLAASIMYGEPCSTVPLFKRPKQ
jgi:Protein of unknown function (DUF2480)